MSKSTEHAPHFFNPGLNPEQLEHWLNQQKLHVASYNRLVKEKAALEERLKEVNDSIVRFSNSGFEGTVSFPYSPIPAPENHQK